MRITDPNYWRQTATPWVSAAVLAGGLVSACILLVVVKIENQMQSTSYGSGWIEVFEER